MWAQGPRDTFITRIDPHTPRPDALIRPHGNGAFIGDNIYETTNYQEVCQTVRAGAAAIYDVKVENDSYDEPINVTGTGSAPGWGVRYYTVDGTEVTDMVTDTQIGWQPETLPAILHVVITPSAGLASGSYFRADINARTITHVTCDWVKAYAAFVAPLPVRLQASPPSPQVVNTLVRLRALFPAGLAAQVSFRAGYRLPDTGAWA